MELHDGCFLAQQLLTQHGLTEKGWRVQLDRAKRRCGQCRYRSRVISLSEFHVKNNSIEEVRDTILHEIAHALVGPGHHHNHVWQAMCVRIGAKPRRLAGENVVSVKGRWTAQCLNCQRSYYRHRRPQQLTGYRCCACKQDITPWKQTFSWGAR